MKPAEKKKQYKGAGHRKRLRDKFLKSGFSGFHDYEVIELLLTIGTPRKDCKAVAKAALQRFKTLHGVFEASPQDLVQVDGIGPNNVFGIKLIKAAAERYLEKKITKQDPINNSKALFDYLYVRIGERNRECFLVIFLDAKNRVIATDILFEGTLTASSVYPREVVRAALEHNAAALIFAHNHPSGDTKPSEDDVKVTHQLVFACRIMGITVHEHLVVGGNNYYSFADHGYLKKINRAFQKYAP